jgi:hypothetical protein
MVKRFARAGLGPVIVRVAKEVAVVYMRPLNLMLQPELIDGADISGCGVFQLASRGQ